jgi:Icc-related predicted phosphoesterase
MVNDLIVAGLEGSMRYRPFADLMYTETEMIGQVARMMPIFLWNRQRYGRALDILVAHSPPWRIHDGRDIAHTGFKIFRTLLTYLKPKYLLHGHIHIYRQDTVRVTQFAQTTVMNVYPYLVFNF